MTLVRDHRERGGESHFITKNHRDFLDGENLRSELLVELEDAPPVYVYRAVEQFVARLGEVADDRPVALSVLREQALDAVKTGLRDSSTVIAAVPDDTDSRRYSIEVVDGEPVEVMRTRRYSRGTEAVTLVTAEWRLTVRCRYQPLDIEDPKLWYAVPEVVVSGPVQVYVPERDGQQSAAQFIAARLTAGSRP